MPLKCTDHGCISCQPCIPILILDQMHIQIPTIRLHCPLPDDVVCLWAWASFDIMICFTLLPMRNVAIQAPFRLWAMPMCKHYIRTASPVPLIVVWFWEGIQTQARFLFEVLIDQALVHDGKIPVLGVGISDHIGQYFIQALKVDEQDSRIPVQLIPAGSFSIHFWTNCHDVRLVKLAGVKLVVEHDVSICVEDQFLVDVVGNACRVSTLLITIIITIIMAITILILIICFAITLLETVDLEHHYVVHLLTCMACRMLMHQ